MSFYVYYVYQVLISSQDSETSEVQSARTGAMEPPAVRAELILDSLDHCRSQMLGVHPCVVQGCFMESCLLLHVITMLCWTCAPKSSRISERRLLFHPFPVSAWAAGEKHWPVRFCIWDGGCPWCHLHHWIGTRPIVQLFTTNIVDTICVALRSSA